MPSQLGVLPVVSVFFRSPRKALQRLLFPAGYYYYAGHETHPNPTGGESRATAFFHRLRQVDCLVMAHIKLKNEQLPGIVGLLDYRPETAKPLRELAEVLLRGPSTLAPGDRELIAAVVSNWNDCQFCRSSHGAAAAAFLNTGIGLL